MKKALLVFDSSDSESTRNAVLQLAKHSIPVTIVGRTPLTGISESDHGGARQHTLGDYDRPEEHEMLFRQAEELAKTWDRCLVPLLGEEPLQFRGLRVAEFLHWDMAYFFFDILRNAILAETILRVEGPDLVLVPRSAGLLAQTVEETARVQSIPVSCYSTGKAQTIRAVASSLQRAWSNVVRPVLKDVALRGIDAVGLPHAHLKPFSPTGPGRQGAKYKVLIPTGIYKFEAVLNKLACNPSEYDFLGLVDGWADRKTYVAHGVPYRTMGAYETDTIRLQATLAKRRLRSAWERAKVTAPMKDVVRSLALQVGDVVARRIEHVVVSKLPEVIRQCMLCEQLLLAENVALVLLWNDVLQKEKIYAHLARLQGIPSLVIQHGITGGWDTLGFLPTTADYIAVWGQASKDWLVAHGAGAEKLVLTGAPHLGGLSRRSSNSILKSKVVRSLKIDPARGIVLLATQPLDHYSTSTDSTARIVQAVAESVAAFPDKQLVVKIHPYYKEREKDYERILRRYPHLVAVATKRASLTDLMRVCDVLITGHSTAGLEAILLGIPLITVNFAGVPDPIPYAAFGAALGVYQPKDLESALRRVLGDITVRQELSEGGRRFASYYLNNGNQGAADAIAEFIGVVVNRKSA